MLKTTVKVGEISNLSDARYCAGMGVEMLGFLLDSKNAIAISDVKEITDWIEGCKYVAEFKESTLSEIENITENFPFDLIQVTDLHLATQLKEQGKKVILESDSLELNETTKFDYIITTNSVKEHDISSSIPIIFGGNILPDELGSILSTPIAGINLLGSEEIRPGYKDFDELADILELLEEE